MSFKNYFKITEEPSKQVLDLLSSTTLGTNGAKYQHLDTPVRIKKLQHPLFLNFQRKENLLANVTVCRRGENWYVRYFAFKKDFKSAGKHKSNSSNSILKEVLNNFFQEKLQQNECENFYAYIDPNNLRSKWMSENFNFKKIGILATQTFSRAFPKAKLDVVKVEEDKRCLELVQAKFSKHSLFTDFHITSNTDPFYVYEKDGEVLAFAKFHKANWKIDCLPGKNGKLLTKVIPFIPFLNRIVKPKAHSFLVPEAVFIKNDNAKVLEQFLETVLAKEKRNLILWWINNQDKTYCKCQKHVNWGLLHSINGVHPVDLVSLDNQNSSDFQDAKFYTSGFDFI